MRTTHNADRSITDHKDMTQNWSHSRQIRLNNNDVLMSDSQSHGEKQTEHGREEG